MNKYRAPRAKLVCLVNACKIILSMCCRVQSNSLRSSTEPALE